MVQIVEFRSALKKGLGRAMLLLRAEPTSPDLQAELLHACKVNLLYDQQCEESRAPYLTRLIHETGRSRFYWDELVGCFGETEVPDSDHDKGQAFEILCTLAGDDASLDRPALRALLVSEDFDAIAGRPMEAFVRLEGIDGLILCCRHFRDEMSREDWVVRALLDSLVERDGAETATAELKTARAGCPELKSLIRLSESDESRAKPEENVLDRAQVAASVAQFNRVPWPWGRDATPADLEWAADQLLAERNDKRILAYLLVFGRRDFPRPPECLFAWAQGENPRIAWQATRALSRICHPEVRKLALGIMSAGTSPENGVRLLRSNFQPGDFTIIERLLVAAEPNECAYHGLQLAILDVLKHATVLPEESRDTLLHLYEVGPCSICRETVVSKLVASGSAPGWMAEECQYDAVPATATLFRSASAGTLNLA
jgi:hypothetical protein